MCISFLFLAIHHLEILKELCWLLGLVVWVSSTQSKCVLLNFLLLKKLPCLYSHFCWPASSISVRNAQLAIKSDVHRAKSSTIISAWNTLMVPMLRWKDQLSWSLRKVLQIGSLCFLWKNTVSPCTKLLSMMLWHLDMVGIPESCACGTKFSFILLSKRWLSFHPS